MIETPAENDLANTVREDQELKDYLASIFGRETVELAAQIDIADLQLNDEMIASIGAGVNKLKELKHDPAAQEKYVRSLERGARILLCMWIMDMDLLDRIQAGSQGR